MAALTFSRRDPHLSGTMDLSEDEAAFLREAVKSARQRVHVVAWTDRDGTARTSAFTAAEVGRLKTIAQRLKISNAEVLRQAAHIPVAR